MHRNTTETTDETKHDDIIRGFFHDKKNIAPSNELRSRIMHAAKKELPRKSIPSPYLGLFSTHRNIAAFMTLLLALGGITYSIGVHSSVTQESAQPKIELTAVEHNAEIDSQIASMGDEMQIDDDGQLNDNDREATVTPDEDGPDSIKDRDSNAV